MTNDGRLALAAQRLLLPTVADRDRLFFHFFCILFRANCISKGTCVCSRVEVPFFIFLIFILLIFQMRGTSDRGASCRHSSFIRCKFYGGLSRTYTLWWTYRFQYPIYIRNIFNMTFYKTSFEHFLLVLIKFTNHWIIYLYDMISTTRLNKLKYSSDNNKVHYIRIFLYNNMLEVIVCNIVYV